MNVTFNLAALLNVLLAVAGVWVTFPELRGRPIKLWRLGLPPIFCTVTAIVMLANSPTVHLLELFWVVAAVVGAASGVFVGSRIKIRTDQMWGTVQFRRSVTGLLPAICIMLLVMADSVAVWIGHGIWPPGHDPAAGAALLSGFLDGRAWKLAANGVRSPHTDLNEH
jgi:hypothetical protein